MSISKREALCITLTLATTLLMLASTGCRGCNPAAITSANVSLTPTGSGTTPPYIAFGPSSATVSAGRRDTVTWTNEDTDRIHSVTFSAPSGAVDQTLYPKNSGKPNTFTWTPAASLPSGAPGNTGDVGTINYKCRLHPGESGTITVNR